MKVNIFAGGLGTTLVARVLSKKTISPLFQSMVQKFSQNYVSFFPSSQKPELLHVTSSFRMRALLTFPCFINGI